MTHLIREKGVDREMGLLNVRVFPNSEDHAWVGQHLHGDMAMPHHVDTQLERDGTELRGLTVNRLQRKELLQVL